MNSKLRLPATVIFASAFLLAGCHGLHKTVKSGISATADSCGDGTSSKIAQAIFDESGASGKKTDDAPLRDIKTAVASLVEKMQDDEGFHEHYDLRLADKGSLPVLQIGNIDNMSEERVIQKLESARRRLEIALRKTRLFDITDDAASSESVSAALADSIQQNAGIGLNDGANLQRFGTHVSADYQIYGRYRSFGESGRRIHELSLQLIDLATGKQVWSDLEEVVQ